MIWQIVFRQKPLKIVTAADHSHGKSLYQFLKSVKEVEPDTPVTVYDLGLSREQREAIKSDFEYEIRTFEYSKYPPFFDVANNAGEYAWKAPIIREAAEGFDGILCWMDAGNVIKKPLERLRKFTQRHGYFSPGSLGKVKDWTHPGMLSFFRLPTDWKKDRKNLSGACVAFDTEHKLGWELLNQWAAFSHVRECIAPVGSSRENHRQDQALLTVLANRLTKPRLPKAWHREFLIHQDSD